MDKDFIYLIRYAIKLVSGKYINCDETSENLGHFLRIYPFTNENISAYINLFDLKDKSLLTVGSSSDQAINAILKDCKDITLLDINPFTKYYFYLKKAALLTLSYEDFCKFFCYIDYPKVFKYNNDCFNYESYNKLKNLLKELDEESYLFWDTLFDAFQPIEIRKNLFSNDEERVSVVKRINPYLNDENKYNEIKIKIRDINPKFINGDIFKIQLERTYDNILLSNVGTYHSIEDNKKLIQRLDRNLNMGGKMLACYLYKTTRDTQYKETWDPMYDLDKTFDILGEYISSFETFTGVQGVKFEDEEMKDSAIIYQKRK